MCGSIAKKNCLKESALRRQAYLLQSGYIFFAQQKTLNLHNKNFNVDLNKGKNSFMPFVGKMFGQGN
jgi:hypothetical protein